MGKWVGGGVEAVIMNYYRHIDRSYFAYARETLGYIAVFVMSATASYLIINQIHLGSTIAQLIINAGVVVAVAGVMIVAVLGRTSSFRYFVGAARTNAKKILCRTRR